MVQVSERFTFYSWNISNRQTALLQVVTQGSRLFLSSVSPSSSCPFAAKVWRKKFVFCYCWVLFVLIYQAWRWHILSLVYWLELSHMAILTAREAVSVRCLCQGRKEGTQVCEQWDHLCQVRWSSVIYQTRTEPLPGARPSACLWWCDSEDPSVTGLKYLL